jgi:hypothetical protein
MGASGFSSIDNGTICHTRGAPHILPAVHGFRLTHLGLDSLRISSDSFAKHFNEGEAFLERIIYECIATRRQQMVALLKHSNFTFR